jgi:hypothetical protein
MGVRQHAPEALGKASVRDVSTGGHVVTVAIMPDMTPGYKDTAAYTNDSMLRTVGQAWGLPSLGNAASATVMQFPY